ncbi:MAG: RpiB/LacA/LacB family sugar-phosphate isomerase [Bacteroidales bacterium]|nr:RpiB/LacA/LacB family sugar-phosphate isomerase [Bacteroidales bacterium]
MKSRTTHTTLKVGLASDHGGFELKEWLKEQLTASSAEVIDFGNSIYDSDDDYPDFIIPLAEAVATGQIDRGIALCGSGVGASLAASAVPGIRAAVIHDFYSAWQGVEDDNLNILCMGGQIIGKETALENVLAFLNASFKNTERYINRLRKIESYTGR